MSTRGFQKRDQTRKSKSTFHQRKRKQTVDDGVPVGQLKKELRDLKRLHSKSGDKLPADVRVEHERKIKSIEEQIKMHSVEDAEPAWYSHKEYQKYRKVRFFESQKANRQLKKAQRRLHQAESEEPRAEVEEEVHRCEVDLNYTLYYPATKAYVGIYANGRKTDGSLDPARGSEMWRRVEEAMANGQLEQLRSGQLLEAGTQRPQPETSKGDTAKLRLEAARPSSTGDGGAIRAGEDDDDGDGEDGVGFFE